GPVICVFDSPDLNDAIKQSNSLATAFQASIFSNDYKEIMEAFYGFDASAVIVNDHTAFRVDWMPFAGRRQSGYGVGGIGYTLEDMTQIKMGVFGN
ncbi:MAG: aldehyde dehydrogenase family protein, partial [Candidatus Puniceispirillaceae bacterium]